MGYLIWIALGIGFGLMWPNPALGEPLFPRVEKKMAAFANNRAAVLIAVGSMAIFLRVLLLGWLPIPQPVIHDEYSYLLAADTFAHGRISNPSHPLSIFFDTFHVIQHPTYSSIYPPMQGAVLALGTLLGHPWIGVLLSTAAMCVAMTWMLQGWLPARWACLGGVLVLLRFGVYSYWINSYWGGSVPATGAALVMGAFPRIIKNCRLRDVIPLASGVIILAMSRPVEGFLYCVPIAISFLWWYFQHRESAERTNVSRISLALALLCACVVGIVVFWNWRVTRSVLVFPTMIEAREYIISPVLVWQHSKLPHGYPNPQFYSFYTSSLPSGFSPGWAGIKAISRAKAIAFWRFFIGPALSIPFLTLPWLLWDRKMSLIITQFGLSAAGLLAVVWFHPHYAAPLMVNVVLLILQGLRRLRNWRFLGRPFGITIVRMTVLIGIFIVPVNLLIFRYPSFLEYWIAQDGLWPPRYFLLLVVTSLVLLLCRLGRGNAMRPGAGGKGTAVSIFELGLFVLAVWLFSFGLRNKKPSDIASQVSPRFTVEQWFNNLPGEHLVIVRYSPKHNVSDEFVYNTADIDGSKTVWAREITGQEITPLLTYFRNRDVWLFEPDEDPGHARPYSPQNTDSVIPSQSAFQNTH